MRINAIPNYTVNRVPSFNGHWEDGLREKYIGYYNGQTRTYVPDANESARSIALAWRMETGEMPIEWVKNHNPYNQWNSPVEYKIKGYAYMPIDVLKASVKLIAERKGDYPMDNIEKYAELAKLEAQRGNTAKTEIYEAKMMQNFRNLPSPKYQEMAEFDINRYKEGLGSSMKTEVRYGKH